jgi:hypothetical protein
LPPRPHPAPPVGRRPPHPRPALRGGRAEAAHARAGQIDVRLRWHLTSQEIAVSGESDVRGPAPTGATQAPSLSPAGPRSSLPRPPLAPAPGAGLADPRPAPRATLRRCWPSRRPSPTARATPPSPPPTPRPGARACPAACPSHTAAPRPAALSGRSRDWSSVRWRSTGAASCAPPAPPRTSPPSRCRTPSPAATLPRARPPCWTSAAFATGRTRASTAPGCPSDPRPRTCAGARPAHAPGPAPRHEAGPSRDRSGRAGRPEATEPRPRVGGRRSAPAGAQ